MLARSCVLVLAVFPTWPSGRRGGWASQYSLGDQRRPVVSCFGVWLEDGFNAGFRSSRQRGRLADERNLPRPAVAPAAGTVDRPAHLADRTCRDACQLVRRNMSRIPTAGVGGLFRGLHGQGVGAAQLADWPSAIRWPAFNARKNKPPLPGFRTTTTPATSLNSQKTPSGPAVLLLVRRKRAAPGLPGEAGVDSGRKLETAEVPPFLRCPKSAPTARLLRRN